MVGVPQELVQEKYNAQAAMKKKKEDVPVAGVPPDKVPIVPPIIAPPINANFQGAMNPPVFYANPIPSIPEELKAGIRINVVKPAAPVIPPPVPAPVLPQAILDPILGKVGSKPSPPDWNDLIYSDSISIVIPNTIN